MTTSDATQTADTQTAATAREGCPAYDRDAVALGPFTYGPSSLYRHLSANPDGEPLSGSALRDCARQWLIGALDDAGVALGAEDMILITELAEQGSDVVQVVAGWIARAHQTTPGHG